MNIRDIEARLGIPRASVRYYEKEGLLHPRRGSNNYRDYSQEDLETLQKIRLLRELDMPIETIRAVQAGERWSARRRCWKANRPGWTTPGRSAGPWRRTG